MCLNRPSTFLRLRQAVSNVWKNTQIRLKAQDSRMSSAVFAQRAAGGSLALYPGPGQLIEVSDGLLKLLQVDSLAQAQELLQQHLALNQADLGDRQQWQRAIQVTGVESLFPLASGD